MGPHEEFQADGHENRVEGSDATDEGVEVRVGHNVRSLEAWEEVYRNRMPGNGTKSKMETVQRFFSGTGASYDHMVALTTLGVDRWWKHQILKRIPKGSTSILDQACGTGILTFEITSCFPSSLVVGVELREEYLRLARNKVGLANRNHVRFIQGRAEDVFLQTQFDCITSSYLAKYAEIPRLVSNNAAMLRRGGVLIMHDFTYPPGPLFARIWEFYFIILQQLGKGKYRAWGTIFHELPVLLGETTWVEQLTRSLAESHFEDIQVRSFTLGTSAVVTARKSW
jgi:demethylmenaquinone methyltransferase / 2-methoxy-6-polyprenyl-1,4-benzoquinol methylase